MAVRVRTYASGTVQAIGDRVNVSRQIYLCTTAGENAGALTGNETGTGIQDGAAVWSSLGPAVVGIPLRNDLPFYDMQAELDGATYTLQFRWNVRLAAWFLTVYDEPGVNVLVGDQRAVANWPLPAYLTTRQPAGLFMFVDTSGQGADPGLTDLGSRVQLIYLTAAGLGL